MHRGGSCEAACSNLVTKRSVAGHLMRLQYCACWRQAVMAAVRQDSSWRLLQAATASALPPRRCQSHILYVCDSCSYTVQEAAFTTATCSTGSPHAWLHLEKAICWAVCRQASTTAFWMRPPHLQRHRSRAQSDACARTQTHGCYCQCCNQPADVGRLLPQAWVRSLAQAWGPGSHVQQLGGCATQPMALCRLLPPGQHNSAGQQHLQTPPACQLTRPALCAPLCIVSPCRQCSRLH
jgi:hypothetical protein